MCHEGRWACDHVPHLCNAEKEGDICPPNQHRVECASSCPRTCENTEGWEPVSIMIIFMNLNTDMFYMFLFSVNLQMVHVILGVNAI